MSGSRSFRVIINLSDFFHDHRTRARIFINDDIKNISDLVDRIENIFHINNFHLTSQNDFLPPSEDVGILDNDDIIWVLRNEDQHDDSTSAQETTNKKTIKKMHKKRSTSPLEESTDEELKSPRRKKKCYNTETEEEECKNRKRKKKSDTDVIIIEDISVTDEHLKKKKKRRHTVDGNMQNDAILNVKFKKKKKKLDLNVMKMSPSQEKCLKVKRKERKSDIGINTEIGKKVVSPKQQEVKETTINEHVIDQTAIKTNEGKDNHKIQILTVNLLQPAKHSHVSTHSKNSTSREDDVSASSPSSPESASIVAKVNDLGKEATNKNGKASLMKEFVPSKDINIVKIEEYPVERNTNFKANIQDIVDQYQESKETAMSPLPIDMIETFSLPTQAETQIEEKCISEDYRTNNNIREVPLVSEEEDLPSNQTCNESMEISLTVESDQYPIVENLEAEYSSNEEMEENTGLNTDKSILTDATTSYPIDLTQSAKVSLGSEPLPEVCNTSNCSSLDIIQKYNLDGLISVAENNISITTTSDAGTENLPSMSRRESIDVTLDETNDFNNPLDETLKASDNSMMCSTQDEISTSSMMSTYRRRPRLDGVGAILTNLRSSISLENINSDSTDFVTKRKRVRKRKKKNQSADTSANGTLLTANYVMPKISKPVKTSVGPSMHIQFVDREDGSVETIDKRKSKMETECNPEKDEVENIDVNSEYFDIRKSYLIHFVTNPQNMSVSPEMPPDEFPGINDIVAFKISKISKTETCYNSPYVSGQVKELNEESGYITFDILRGLKQLYSPTVYIGRDIKGNKTKSTYCTLLWSDVKEPRLVLPVKRAV